MDTEIQYLSDLLRDNEEKLEKFVNKPFYENYSQILDLLKDSLYGIEKIRHEIYCNEEECKSQILEMIDRLTNTLMWMVWRNCFEEDIPAIYGDIEYQNFGQASTVLYQRVYYMQGIISGCNYTNKQLKTKLQCFKKELDECVSMYHNENVVERFWLQCTLFRKRCRKLDERFNRSKLRYEYV